MARMVYFNLLQQTNQASVVAALPTNNVRLIETARPPEEPVSPKPIRDIPMMTVLFGGVAFGLLLLLDHLKSARLAQTVSEPGSTSLILNVPELGVIPSAGPPKPPQWKAAAAFLRRGGEEPPPVKGDFFSQPESSYLIDSFRFVFAALLTAEHGILHKVVLLTSPGPGEGKTTLSGNLAYAIASTGKKVLLIDADLRRPSVHRLFGVESGRGLYELLKDDTPLTADSLQAAVHQVKEPNLHLLMAGKGSHADDAATLLFSPKTAELLALARREFDFVLVDSAPALLCPDARLLGRIADGVILVVRAGVTHQSNAVTAANHFRQDGIPVLGTILNDWDPAASPESYRYHYGSYYKQYGK
jgi:capsular exopolysaccharide synthesis family protein